MIFYFNECPKDIPDDITTNVHHSDPNWSEVDVPGNWKLQWHGTAVYTDGNYDFCPKNPVPPYLPERIRLVSIVVKTLRFLRNGSLKDDEENVTIFSEKVEFLFSKTEKKVKSYKVDGFDYISKGFGFQPNFWRGPTDNDYGNGAPKREQLLKIKSHEFTIDKCDSTIENNAANLSVIYILHESCSYEVNYQFFATGIINAKASYKYKRESGHLKYNSIPRIGIRFRIPVDLHVEWNSNRKRSPHRQKMAGTPRLIGERTDN